MYLKRESYVEVRHQGCLYSYFYVDGDDKNRYMSLSELLQTNTAELLKRISTMERWERDESGIKGCTGRI